MDKRNRGLVGRSEQRGGSRAQGGSACEERLASGEQKCGSERPACTHRPEGHLHWEWGVMALLGMVQFLTGNAAEFPAHMGVSGNRP